MSNQLILQFVDFLQQSSKSNSTIIAYKKDLEQLTGYVTKPLELAIAEDIKAAIATMQSEFGFTNKTISRKINSFRTFYRYLIDNGSIAFNPAEAVAHPKLKPKTPRVLSPMEYLALREITRDNPRLHNMIELLLQTGIRIGELSRIVVADIDIKRGKALLHVKGFSTIPTRIVPLNIKAAQAVKQQLTLTDSGNSAAPLFATRDGRSIIVRNIRSSIDRAMAKAGINNACVNDLRNTFIERQLEAGVPIDLVSEVVGHKSRATTAKYFGSMNGKYKATGVNRIVEV